MVLWKHNLDSSSIFSGPVLSDHNIFVTTLRGNLFSVSPTTGDVIWQCELGKPVFTSPVINSRTSRLFVGCCGGVLHCLTFDNNKVNNNFFFCFSKGRSIRFCFFFRSGHSKLTRLYSARLV